MEFDPFNEDIFFFKANPKYLGDPKPFHRTLEVFLQNHLNDPIGTLSHMIWHFCRSDPHELQGHALSH